MSPRLHSLAQRKRMSCYASMLSDDENSTRRCCRTPKDEDACVSLQERHSRKSSSCDTDCTAEDGHKGLALEDWECSDDEDKLSRYR